MGYETSRNLSWGKSYAQGRNAIAGAVVMTSNDPTQEWEGAAKLNMGTHRLAQTAARISGPVVKDELAFRLSVDHQQRETSVDLPHYDPVGNPRWFKATNTRAKLLWMPSALPDLYSRLTFNHLNARAPQSFSGKVGVNYRLLDHLEIGTNYSYNSSYYSTADNLANGKVGHYNQLDVYLAYDFKHAKITLYADNVLNSRKDILLVPRSGDITRQPERQIGLSTELRF